MSTRIDTDAHSDSCSDTCSDTYSDTDIAIVGMSGRFPGADDVGQLWNCIRDGRSGITRFTDAELRSAGVPAELVDDASYVKAGAVINGVELFDAGFFGVGPKEAQILDPQQRLYLEHNWHALEDAGCDPSRFDGTVGVFGGAAWSTYLQNNLMPSGVGATMGELAVGLANDKDSLATRVAHTLGLTGPAYSVQSYCSTSLVAVCAASSSLANFECDLALAGGIAVSVPHRVGYLYQPGGIAPPDGECRAFDAAGLGAPLGNGVGVVALRRLADALAGGDRIYAVIRGWAVNNDGGRKVGFTAPGVQGQIAVIAEALSSADLSAADIDYVEAHGTGTALGDAAELAALQQVFDGEDCLIGSVKTNVGHLDRAAGVTGLIKTVLSMRNAQLPPTRNLTTPNPQLGTGSARLEVVTELRDWPRRDDRPRRAGVSAFGIGGTNAHVVLEEPPAPNRAASSQRPQLLVWSARNAAAADALSEQLAGHLASEAAVERIGDVAHTLQSGRRVFEHRRALVSSSMADAVDGLRAGRVLSDTTARSERGAAFLIAGTGEQYPGLAEDLYRTEPVFRAALDECRAVLTERLGGIDPLAEMLEPRQTGDAGLAALFGRGEAPDAGSGDATDRLQPATFAVGYALARLLMSWGIRPAVLAGYSVGEYVAACLSGVLSLESALALVARRAQLINELPAGAMVAVPLPAAELRPRLDEFDLDVAAINGPQLTVVSGAPDAVEAFRAALAEDSIVSRPLATTHAFHSRMLVPVQAALTEWITANVQLGEPTIPTVSNVTGALLTVEQATDPGYWAEHMCAPVLFDAALETVLAQGDYAIVELGPGQSLGAMARGHRDCAPERWRYVVATLPAAGDPRPASTVVTDALGRLWLGGAEIDWAGYQAGQPVAKIGLPGYPFQRERYWIEAPSQVRAAASVPPSRGDQVELLRPTWIEAEITAQGTPERRCVVLGGSGVAVALADSLRGRGIDVHCAPGETGAVGPLADTPTAVLDLRLLDDAADAAGPGSVLRVAALVDQWGSSGAGTTKIIVVTSGGQAVTDGERPAPGQAAAGVLPVVANHEYLSLECRALDLDPDGDAAAHVHALESELGATGADVLVAYRAGRRYVRDFVPADPDGSAAPVPIRSGGTYLVTGGLGEVGLLVAEHLARRGAGRLVLTSRSADENHPALAALRRFGAEVNVARADVTDDVAMRAVFAEATRDGGRIDGIIHAAAETNPDTFRPLRDLDLDIAERHFGAKVNGAQVLSAILAEQPATSAPEFCVLFSSTSSILGGFAFGSYAAANAALTAIAQHHDCAATRWIAAAWDTWSSTLERLEGGVGAAMLTHAMTAQAGLAALEQLLKRPRPSIVVAASGLTDRLPLCSTSPDVVAGHGERFARPDLPQPYSPPLTATERALAELWSGVLGIEPVGTRDNFFDLGGNSLLALQMLALVKKQLGVAIATVALFEAPTVHSLATIMDAQTGTASASPAPAPVTPARTVTPDRDLDRRIAVVGMAGRFPGANDVASFWQNLCNGVESISFFSREELLAAGVDAALIDDPAYVPARPVLSDVSGFDAQFFGISPRMAALTDPQQRLFLEVCWEALEQAGYAAAEHRDRVGVYGGTNLSTYLLQMPPESITGGDVSTYEIIMGNEKDALTTTVSYLFDLHGPSVAVQTFCSTSLVATHLAVQSLRNGECELAMAGGVSIRVPQKVGHKFGPGGMESPDGHVRTFDAKARGSMFGDGAAVVVLKRLADAVRDGDHIWSVIRGSAMNNDGALKVGYTAPSVVGQAQVIADALADADATGEDISYVEAHGTATELGDPIEVAALTRAFGPTAEHQYCPIGSVKTNVGHLDRAAGATGLIKTSLALRDGVIPPTLHYTSPNPEIDFEHSPFYVNTKLATWQPRAGRIPMAGINSLGMGGTNVHVVVEQAPVRDVAESPADETARRYHVVPVSARTETAADQWCEQLSEHLTSRADASQADIRLADIRLADVAYTLQVGRKTFEHRRATVASSVEDATKALAATMLRRIDTARGRQVAFLFTGVGEQYPGLVRELYHREPVFRAALSECLEHLQLDVDALELLTGPREADSGLAAMLGRDEPGGLDARAAALQRTAVVQPALFAVEYALASTLIDWGIRPRVMLGYSLGEYVAACLAGVLSLPDALALVAHRARLIATIDPGAMVAVSLGEQDLRSRFDLGELDVAAANGPQVSVVAGPVNDIKFFTAQLRANGIACRPLATTDAFHSRMLLPVSDELTAWVRDNVTLNPPALPYISNVTGGYVDAELVCDPGYWAKHMCGTVQFAAGVETLLSEPELAIVEIGPGHSLGALLRSCGAPREQWPLILSVLPAGRDTRADDAVLTGALARLWLAGVEIDWPSYHGRRAPQPADSITLPGRIPLPTYPFQRQHFWIDGGNRSITSAAAQVDPEAEFTLDTIAALPKLPEEEWLYLPVWRQTAPPASSTERAGSWLVYAAEGVAGDIVERLGQSEQAAGATLRFVRPGQAYAVTGDGYEVRPGNLEDTLALLHHLQSDGVPLERVVHLWGMDWAPEEGLVVKGLHTLVALARAAGELGICDWSLDVVVSGTQQVLPNDVTSPLAATLTGPCRVIPLEYPDVRTRLIDVDGRPGPRAVAAVVEELHRPHTDALVALRHGRRWLPDYELLPAPAATPSATGLRDGGVYLITGGMGGIALGIAERLVRDRDAKLVLLSRRERPKLAAWPQGFGANVEVVTGDATNPDDVRRAIEVALEKFGALHGVLHAAGLPAAGLMQFKRPEELDTVLAPKLTGALALAEALRIGKPDEIELDFLVLFSSITSSTGGGPGQVDYCAANAFLDSFAYALSAEGRTVLSIDWGEWTWNAWEDGLGGYNDTLQEFFRENRARIGIDFEEGWRSLQRALASGEPRVVVCSQDFPTMVRYSSRFTVAVATSPALAGGGERHARPELVTAYQEPSGPVEQSIAAIWCESLRLETVGVQDNFFELGGNSLLGVSIVAALRHEFPDAELAPHVLYEAPTVTALAVAIEAGGAAGEVNEQESQVRAQLRRSGIQASAGRRRGL